MQTVESQIESSMSFSRLGLASISLTPERPNNGAAYALYRALLIHEAKHARMLNQCYLKPSLLLTSC